MAGACSATAPVAARRFDVPLDDYPTLLRAEENANKLDAFAAALADAPAVVEGGDQRSPDAVEPLVDYYRSIAGEHSDWAEYRRAMSGELPAGWESKVPVFSKLLAARYRGVLKRKYAGRDGSGSSLARSRFTCTSSVLVSPT